MQLDAAEGSGPRDCVQHLSPTFPPSGPVCNSDGGCCPPYAKTGGSARRRRLRLMLHKLRGPWLAVQTFQRPWLLNAVPGGSSNELGTRKESGSALQPRGSFAPRARGRLAQWTGRRGGGLAADQVQPAGSADEQLCESGLHVAAPQRGQFGTARKARQGKAGRQRATDRTRVEDPVTNLASSQIRRLLVPSHPV